MNGTAVLCSNPPIQGRYAHRDPSIWCCSNYKLLHDESSQTLPENSSIPNIMCQLTSHEYPHFQQGLQQPHLCVSSTGQNQNECCSHERNGGTLLRWLPTDPLSTPPGFWFERSEQAATENRGQISSYLAVLSGSQFCVHILSVSICRLTAYFIRWDRAGAIVTQSFNYLKQPHILADFFWWYSHLDCHQQGYDLTVSVPSNEEIKQAMLYECHLQNANPAHRKFCKLMVPECDNPDQEHPFLISSPPYYASHSPFLWPLMGFWLLT